jgi:hypothetical protein
MLTLVDLMDRLRKMEETALLELLDLSSEEIVDRFWDVIEVNYDELLRELEELPYDTEK